LISPRPFQLVKLRKTTPMSGTTANARKKISAGAASHPEGPASRTPRLAGLREVTVSYFPIVAFMVVTNCSGLIFFRKIWSRLDSMASPCAGLRAWSQERVKLGASLANP
jgi:hypothetical protein